MSDIRIPFTITYFFFCLFFFTLFSSGFIDSQDGFQYTAIARRIYYNHSFELPPEQYPDDNIHMSLASDGARYSPTGLGYTLALLPAVFMEDVFLKISGSEPISGFPLHADWPVLLFASMTNAVFGALLAVILYKYLLSLGLNHKASIILSFLGIVSTNLFAYTKHVYPHMMFTSFLLTSFYFIRKHSLTNQRRWLLISGFCFGIVILTYNQTYLLTIPPLILYIVLLNKQYWELVVNLFLTVKKRNHHIKSNISRILRSSILDALTFIIGVYPVWMLYSWFNHLRFGNSLSSGYGEGIPLPLIPPPYALFEGLWGVLFSPGRSPFMYSPILLVLIFFWWKLKSKVFPEVFSFLLLTVIYLVFFGTLMGGPTYMVWHGEMSWGNRYIITFLPFLWILCALIYKELKKYQKLFLFAPLIALGIFIQIVGVLLPYQIKTAGLPLNLYITQDKHTDSLQYNYGEYPNFLPRFSAVYVMSKTLVKRLKKLPRLYNYGEYNLMLKDGIEEPFLIGESTWRGMRSISEITFTSGTDDPPNKLTLFLYNHIMDETSSRSAFLTYQLNGTKLADETVVNPGKSVTSDIKIDPKLLANLNDMRIDLRFEGTPSSTLKKKQVLFLQGLAINNKHQNLETINYPYYSPVSRGLSGEEYLYWGGVQKNLWDIWNQHSRVYEMTFDLWWLRPFHYWDLPKLSFTIMFSLNLTGFICAGYYVIGSIRRK